MSLHQETFFHLRRLLAVTHHGNCKPNDKDTKQVNLSFILEVQKKMDPGVERAGSGYVNQEERVEHRAGAWSPDGVSHRLKGGIPWIWSWEGPAEDTCHLLPPCTACTRKVELKGLFGVSI